MSNKKKLKKLKGKEMKKQAEEEKRLGILFKMFIWNQSEEIMMEEWGRKNLEKGDSNCWSMDEKGFGLYMKMNGKGLGIDIDFTPEQQQKILPLLTKLREWCEKYGE